MRALSSLLVLVAVPTALAVKSHDFKTCSQAGFCRRGRALSARAAENPAWRSPYVIDASTVALSTDQSAFTAAVKSAIYPDVKFGLDVRIHEDGVVRVRMDEVDGLYQRYNEAASWALLEEPKVSSNIQWTSGKDGMRAVYGPKNDIQVTVAFEPLKVTMTRGGVEQVILNGRGLLHMEHFRTKDSVAKSKEDIPVPEEGLDTDDSAQVVIGAHPRTAWFEGDSEDGWWEETFNSFSDPKKRGRSVGHSCSACSKQLIYQDLSLFLSILISPITVMSTAYPSTRPVCRCPLRRARTHTTPTPTACTTPMSLSTWPTQRCRCTVPSLSCMHTQRIQLSPSSTPLVRRRGSTLAGLHPSPRRRTGFQRPASWTFSSSLARHLQTYSRSTLA